MDIKWHQILNLISIFSHNYVMTSNLYDDLQLLLTFYFGYK